MSREIRIHAEHKASKANYIAYLQEKLNLREDDIRKLEQEIAELKGQIRELEHEICQIRKAPPSFHPW